MNNQTYFNKSWLTDPDFKDWKGFGKTKSQAKSEVGRGLGF